MLRLGWLDKPDDRYRIGNRLFEISGLAPIRHELREAVLPFLQDLYEAIHTTVQLGVLDGAQVLIVEKITGHRPMPMLSQVGGTIPAHCSGLGRAILAYSERRDRRRGDRGRACAAHAADDHHAGSRCAASWPRSPTGAGRSIGRRATSASPAWPRRSSGRSATSSPPCR